jgi:hypothetical protein
MLSSPRNSITTRSSPTPNPPCGKAPNLNESMYDWMLSSGMSHARARSAAHPVQALEALFWSCLKREQAQGQQRSRLLCIS